MSDLEWKADLIVSELGDRSLRGDAVLATMLLRRLDPEWRAHLDYDFVRGRAYSVARMRSLIEQTSDQLAALERIVDHVEAVHPRSRRLPVPAAASR